MRMIYTTSDYYGGKCFRRRARNSIRNGGIKVDIDDLKEQFSRRVMEKGALHYMAGDFNISKFDIDEWNIIIKDGKDRTVRVLFSEDGEITAMDCDCQNDGEGRCSHQAAAVFVITDRLQMIADEAMEEIEEKDLENILDGLDREELLRLVNAFADRDRIVKLDILLRYSERDVTCYAEEIMDEMTTVEKTYDMYGDHVDAEEGAYMVTEAAKERARRGDAVGAASLFVAVMNEIMHLWNRHDDPNGFLEEIMDDTIEEMMQMLSGSIAAEQSMIIFDMVFDHALDPIYDDVRQRNDILYALLCICDVPVNREKMEKHLSGSHGGRWHPEYTSPKMLHYNLIKRFDGDAAADAFAEQNLDDDDMKLTYTRMLMNKGRYEEALDRCSAGEASGNARLSEEFTGLRYEIYGETGKVDEQKETGLRLLMIGALEYIDEIKDLYPEDKWPSALRNILDALRDNDHKGAYPDILLRENMLPELLEHCKKNPALITVYGRNLASDHKKDVREIFLKHIRAIAANAKNRSDYDNVCGTIWMYGHICNEDIDRIRNELLKKYARRKEFREELEEL